MAESFSREKLRPAPQKESGTSNELDVQDEWEENTHIHTRAHNAFPCIMLPYGEVIEACLSALLFGTCFVVVVVFFTLTDRASTIPSNTRGC